MADKLIISTGKLTPQTLAGQVAIVTGGGSGIGFEAARALAWMGARIVIAEIDKKAGLSAAKEISASAGNDIILSVQTDVGEERSIQNMASKTLRTFGKVDIVLNNAAVEPIGAVKDAPIESWDLSYKVNLRGPVLIARAFLPQMLKRNSGVFVCISSVGGAFMGSYEVLKRAQVEMANTVSSEREGTDVASFVIGPGLVPETRGDCEQIPKIAKMMGKTIEEFQDMSKASIISVEAAGAGFAAAVALASRFRGQEISSFEALIAAGIELDNEPQPSINRVFTQEEIIKATDLCSILRAGLEEQLRQWQGLGVFQRQWIMRDFSKRVGMTIEKVLEKVVNLEKGLLTGKTEENVIAEIPLIRLADYFGHLQDMTTGYVKDAKVRKEQILIQQEWKDSAKKINALLN